MDLGGAVYVSRVDSDEFERDDEVGGFMHVLFEEGEAMAGLWKPDQELTRDYVVDGAPARETIVVLSGSTRIEVQGGPTLDLSVGDIASLPKGAVTKWSPSLDFKKVWVNS